MLRRESAAQVASAGLPGDQKCSGHRDAGFLEARRCHRGVVRPDQQRSPTRTGSAIPAGQEGGCDRQRKVTPRPSRGSMLWIHVGCTCPICIGSGPVTVVLVLVLVLVLVQKPPAP
jgi:hypothetical protein